MLGRLRQRGSLLDAGRLGRDSARPGLRMALGQPAYQQRQRQRGVRADGDGVLASGEGLRAEGDHARQRRSRQIQQAGGRLHLGQQRIRRASATVSAAASTVTDAPPVDASSAAPSALTPRSGV